MVEYCLRTRSLKIVFCFHCFRQSYLTCLMKTMSIAIWWIMAFKLLLIRCQSMEKLIFVLWSLICCQSVDLNDFKIKYCPLLDVSHETNSSSIKMSLEQKQLLKKERRRNSQHNSLSCTFHLFRTYIYTVKAQAIDMGMTQHYLRNELYSYLIIYTMV